MPTITSLGVGSGLDASSIISSLMAVERKPITQLQKAQSEMKTQLSSFGKLQSLMSGLRDASNALVDPNLWKGTVAKSADDASVVASSSGGAAAGSYAVSVQSLASGQTVASKAFASSSATVGSGTLTNELGSWTGSPASGFTPKSGASPVAIEIGPDDTSLSSIRDKINGANAGVTATIINDAQGARLSIRSAATGEENAFRITAAETADDGVAATGLSALAYSATSPSEMSRSQTAANARATINGIQLSSASNKLENVADGLTLNLKKVTSGDVDVSVASDGDAVKKKIEDFVKAFNDLASNIRETTKYDAGTKVAGPLQGDRSVIGLQSQLRAVLNEASSASGAFGRLSDIGIAMKSDGTLETKSSKLDTALGNLPELQKLFANDGADNASSGFARRFKKLADQMLGSEGMFETRNAGLNGSISRNGKQQDAMSARLAQMEARLTKQYQQLDLQMAKLNKLGNYVNQQVNAWSK